MVDGTSLCNVGNANACSLSFGGWFHDVSLKEVGNSVTEQEADAAHQLIFRSIPYPYVLMITFAN